LERDLGVNLAGAALAVDLLDELERLRLRRFMRLAKVDTEAEQMLGARFGIRSISTLALFHGGLKLARQPGAMGAADIVRWARSHWFG
jgi:thioredoxin-like negative regulator of GroEL